MGEQGALDPEAAAELDKIKGKLAKYKGKMGKGFDDLAVDELEWMDNNKNVKAITIIFYTCLNIYTTIFVEKFLFQRL